MATPSFIHSTPSRLRPGRLAAGLREARQTGGLHVLVVLLLPVPFLLAAHQLHRWGVAPFLSRRWAVHTDRSWIELLGYAQLAAASALLLFVVSRRRRGSVYVGWAATLAVVVLDDALQFHERGGMWLVPRLAMPRPFGLPEQAVGELATWGLLGIPVLLVLWATHRVSPTRARQNSWRLAGLVVLLMTFGVGVDALHDAVQEVTSNAVIDRVINFVEAGGEVGAMTAVLAYVVHITRRVAAHPEPGEPRATVLDSRAGW